MLRKLIFLLCVLVCVVAVAFAKGDKKVVQAAKPTEAAERKKWVDSVYNNLTLTEKIAQFFMVAAYSNKDEAHVKEIEKLVRDTKVGGLIFMQGNPGKEAELTNRYQALAQTKLLISIDGEWGLQMRLKDSTLAFPRQLTLGAITNDSLIYEMGKEIAKHCKRIGIAVDFAPDVDVNSNPLNPVIGDRSFGEDKLRVAAKGIQYMKGLQDEGVMACAKHFPGHGDAATDSHLTLPVINRTREQLDSVELYTFRELIKNNVQSVMAAHLSVPALDDSKNIATSLSRKVVTDLLKKKMGFKGLVFSDALNMKGVSDFYAAGDVAVKAFQAGNDILLFAGDVPKSIALFKAAIKKKDIDTVDMGRRLKILLGAKYDAGLVHYEPIKLENIYNDLNDPHAKLIRRQLYEQAVTLVSNNNKLLPIKALDTLTFASVAIGVDSENEMQSMLGNYAPFNNFTIKKDADSAKYAQLYSKASSYKVVIISLHDMVKAAGKNYGITDNARTFIQKLSTKTKVVLVVFGTPYSLKYFDGMDNVVEMYEDNADTREVAAEAIFGAIPMTGTLPVTASPIFKAGKGISTAYIGRLKYTMPEETGLHSADFKALDSIAEHAIKEEATPGCQMMVVKDGKVIYYRSFGKQIYGAGIPIKNNTIYDLASVTKIAGTTPGLMYLYDHKKFDLTKTLADYIPGIDSTQVHSAKMYDIMTHQAGLRPFIPFYKRTLNDTVYNVCYKNERDSVYCIEVRKDLFLRKDYRDTIFQGIYNDSLEASRGNTYSDLGFYLLKQITESLTRDSFQHFLDSTFYRPLGMGTMGFLPLNRFPLERIPPTEDDKEFRKALVHGYVHDQGAAMLGGISGHAGLFSDANDLAILMQMLLNNGTYAGRRYIDSATVKLFTSKYREGNRRGLGFDKPETDATKQSPASDKASPQAFGHQGFTGTCVWSDPKYNVTFIFLSNRIYPSADNKKLTSMAVRTKLQDAVYDAILKGEKPQ